MELLPVLSDEEIKHIYDKIMASRLPDGSEAIYWEQVEDKAKEARRDIAQAQRKADIKNIYDWGNEPCPHDVEISMNFYGRSEMVAKNLARRRRHCELCWQSLKEEGIQ